MASNEDLEKAGQLFAERVEPRLRGLLAKTGVRHASELPRDEALEIFRKALVETVAATAPEVSVVALNHVLRSVAHPAFGRAFDLAKASAAVRFDAFATVAGVDAAIVLAGLGLPVAPLDRKTLRILTAPSNDIDEVVARFSKFKSALVGYSACDLPFYMLLTDCLVTLAERVPFHPLLAGVKQLIDRAGGFSQPYTPPFQHGLLLFARMPGDRFEAIMLHDRNPSKGSIMLQAGWTVHEHRFGAPNDGYLPVPMQFFQNAIDDPAVAMWIWRQAGKLDFIN
jgi:hypothetical protein